MKNINTITGYCEEINIPPPRYSFFDIRRFEENMKTVNPKQAPFRHEFYAIALRHSGGNKEVMGKVLNSSLFFNSPYQIITWDIVPNWKGWYIIFGKEFISMNKSWDNFILEYPFFRIDKYVAFDLPGDEFAEADQYFQKIFSEYHSDNKDKFAFIQAYTQILLSITKRNFEKLELAGKGTEDNRTADILLVSKFQTLIETYYMNEDIGAEVKQPSFYASHLGVHPNHLNAVVKRITDKTASQIVQQYFISFAKSLLLQTELSIKEIAYRLHFLESSHFIAFFRKYTGLSPQQYRTNNIL